MKLSPRQQQAVAVLAVLSRKGKLVPAIEVSRLLGIYKNGAQMLLQNAQFRLSKRPDGPQIISRKGRKGGYYYKDR